jgi:hypothetical protein
MAPKVVIVDSAEIAEQGTLSARYFTGRRDGESYPAWRMRAAAEFLEDRAAAVDGRSARYRAEAAELMNRRAVMMGEAEAPPLAMEAEQCVQQAAALREAVISRDWHQAYACADWLRDLARDIRHATKPGNRSALTTTTTKENTVEPE